MEMPGKHIPRSQCPHFAEWKSTATSQRTRCIDCGLPEDLRICATCGYVTCCEIRAAHCLVHYERSRHPLLRPYRTGTDWLWCYECKAYLD